MVQQIVNFFSKKVIIKTQKGFSDIKPYIYNKIFEVKKHISNEGINLLSFYFIKIIFNIKNYLGFYGIKKKNMWEFIETLVFIETVSENLDDIVEIYHRVNQEARDILTKKLKRANLHTRFREYLFFAILLCIFFFTLYLLFPIEYLEYILVGLILFTLLLYFIPFFLLSYRNRTYWSMNYYLQKESRDNINRVKLFNKQTILFIGILNKIKYIRFKSLEDVYDFVREKGKGEWKRSTIKNLIYNFDNIRYNDDRTCLIKRLDKIKTICNISYKNHSNNSDEISILPTRSDATLIVNELQKVKLETKLNIYDLRNIIELLISDHLFDNPNVNDISEYYTKDELSNISMIIDKLTNKLLKKYSEKFDLNNEDIDCDKKR